MELETEMEKLFINSINNINKLNIMNKIKDIQKQLDNFTNDLKILKNKQIILIKTYNILLINDRKELIK
jgi:hypothetical protein